MKRYMVARFGEGMRILETDSFHAAGDLAAILQLLQLLDTSPDSMCRRVTMARSDRVVASIEMPRKEG